jgi:hypothetical protein
MCVAIPPDGPGRRLTLLARAHDPGQDGANPLPTQRAGSDERLIALRTDRDVDAHPVPNRVA